MNNKHLAYQKEYSEYKKLNRNESFEHVIYKNKLFIQTGRAIVAPHPHRMYNLMEFVFWCGKNVELFNRY